MKRYDSKRVPLPPISPRATVGELIFYEVDRSGPSFEARVFINNTRADARTPLELSHGFVGAFTIFGHGGCVGDEGHCDRHAGQDDPFDLRLPQGLPAMTKTVPLSDEAVQHLRGGKDFTLTVVPVEPGENGPRATDAFAFEGWRVATYEP